MWGIVQGVGFRPYTAKLADSMGMKGEVRNLGGLVEISVTDLPERIDAFITELRAGKPLPAEIVHIRVEDQPLRTFEDFRILDSGDGGDEAAMIPADLAICPDCLRELRDAADPRWRHPFISCMACGPRYTIIDRIPYDRENTAMSDFAMCPLCEGEYADLDDRRHHAQTISCHDCGPYAIFAPIGPETAGLKLEDNFAPQGVKGPTGADFANGRYRAANEAALSDAAALINRGGIVTLKATGGYNFVCSPFNRTAVRRLRDLKGREDKPFAVMFADMAQIRKHCAASVEEEELLLSAARPIVLLEQLDGAGRAMPEEVSRSSRFIGAFLPSIGIQHLLIDDCGPLIMTSANLTDQPIIIDDDEMAGVLAARLKSMARQGLEAPETAMLYNTRAIRIRMDDSVTRIIDGQPQMIRRSKGYAPVPVHLPAGGSLGPSDMILAAGGQLKSSFCLTKGPFAYISQYFGDLDSVEATAIYIENIERMKSLFRIEPGLAVCDLHPLYFTSRHAEELAGGMSGAKGQAGVLRVQHHHAHVASVIAEHDLKGPVLGVSFDGTGYGPDGAVWGGEFLLCEGTGFERVAHLDYIRMIGGDESMKEGWKSAMCYLMGLGLQGPMAADPRWPIIASALENRVNTIESSSMGRLFDAAAALTGIRDVSRYEGECAIMLENAAADAIKNDIAPLDMAFDIDDKLKISAGPVFAKILEGLDRGCPAEGMALGFHQAVASMIHDICRRIRERDGIGQIALTGGVFQNRVLMEMTLSMLRSSGFKVYYNISVGPNDGGICLGQAYLGMKHLAERKQE